MPQAVIDLGTNTFNLVIAETSTKEVLYNEKIPVRLGKNGISKGIIQPDAIDRAIHALLHYRQKIEEHSVEKTTVTATSAVRNASNQSEFVNQVLEKVGFEVKVLSGDNEAAVIHAGVSNYLEIGNEPQLIIARQLLPVRTRFENFNALRIRDRLSEGQGQWTIWPGLA